jgi:branched-subunit amino acid ABC-type transport system permease component
VSLVVPAIVDGIVIAGLYGLLATGIVIVYNVSGVINFAQGAIAVFSVFVLKVLLDHGVRPYGVAMLIAVGVGVTLGIAIDRLTIAPIRQSSALNKAIVTVGWLILLQALASIVFNAGVSTNIPPLLSHDRLFSVGGLGLSSQDVGTLVIALLIGAGLTAFFRRTYAGVAVRAAAQNVDATRLMGVSVNRVSALAWGLGGGLAAIGGILVVPKLGAIDSTTLTLYVIQSFAAALIGGLRSLPRTALGALALGITQSLIGVIPGTNGLPGLKFTTAFVLIVIALFVRPDLTRSGVQAVSERVVAVIRPRAWTITRWSVIGALALFFVLMGTSGAGDGVFGDFNRFRWAQVFADTVIFMSLVMLVGFVGQISLCQVSFAGFGAFFSAVFVTDWGLPFYAAIPLAALCTAPIGALVGIPALRIRGLQLAVVTLAFALVCDQLFFAQSFPLSGGPSGRPIGGDSGPFSLTGDSTYHQLFWVFLGTVAALGLAAQALRRSPSGRTFFAVRDSENAATAVGISLARVKLGAFALAAGCAALGGGMVALTLQNVSSTAFNIGLSIQYLALVILAGVRSVWGAFIAAVFVVWGDVVVKTVLAHLGLDTSQADNWQLFLAGLLLIATVIANPRGIVGGLEEIPVRILHLRHALRRRQATTAPAGVETA